MTGPRAPAEAERINLDETLSIARGKDGTAARRLLRFIHGGRYLRRTGVFLNRYLIGLLLIWIVAFSGLIAAASGTAYLFRTIDTPAFRDWMGALRFNDDLRLAFFPSFVVLFLWLIAWGVSYFRRGRNAGGAVARGLFYLLIVTTLVAMAALLGTGDIDLASFADLYGKEPEREKVNEIESVIHKTVLVVIIAALLPYFRPARLIRSGTDPGSAIEKYTYWVATRALIIIEAQSPHPVAKGGGVNRAEQVSRS